MVYGGRVANRQHNLNHHHNMSTVKTSTKETYIIVSGEGEVGSIRTVKCTTSGLKRILASERASGYRWAYAKLTSGERLSA